jgi:hypothetical protein
MFDNMCQLLNLADVDGMSFNRLRPDPLVILKRLTRIRETTGHPSSTGSIH